MENVEESLEKLLKDCESLLGRVKAVASDSVTLGRTHQKARREKKEKLALSFSDGHAWSSIQKLPLYEICQKAFENDDIFKDAPRLAGYWGTFAAVFQDILYYCARIRKNRIIFDTERAINRLSNFRLEFSASNVSFTSTATVLGTRLECKEIVLPDGLSLYRLNKREVKERQQFIEHRLSRLEAFQISSHTTELRMTFNMPVESKASAFFDTENEATRVVRNTFMNVIDALLLTKDGQVGLGPQSVYGGPIGGVTEIGSYPRFIPNPNVVIHKREAQRIAKAYGLVSGKANESDKVISRALHRFLLGRRRLDLVDKFIDYVISWESLLLTQDGGPIKQELVYRFSINGSSLIATMSRNNDRKQLFKMMRCIYDLRSEIVHGGDDTKIDRRIKAGGFSNLDEVCRFLESNFKMALWWLIDMVNDDRPYMKKNGWEDLLWS
ncbi:MAG: hypothetical protein JRJ83_14295 [Deltaproteobacteria bacterium]|nr:hypothetical protein [Deltaproteobacteria bacterium]